MDARPGRQRGIALMLVMWVLTLLTVMAVSLTATQRTETALTDNQVSAMRFRVLADAAIAYAALHFMTQDAQLDEETGSAWLPNGSQRVWRFAGSELTLAVFNESSRYNLNQVSAETLRQLLEILGLEFEEAEALAAAILDWRDEDDLTQPNGAEDRDYEQAGRAIGAKDAPYESVAELRQVLGMTEEIYRRLAPEVTVDAETGQPVERFASAPVLATLKGISLDEASEEIAIRDEPAVAGASSTQVVDRGGPLYRIQVSELGPGVGRRMEALFQLSTGQASPYQVLWRRYGLEGERLSEARMDE
jgi:general secretion pathway protein K